jgi:hypothetical protein
MEETEMTEGLPGPADVVAFWFPETGDLAGRREETEAGVPTLRCRWVGRT